MKSIFIQDLCAGDAVDEIFVLVEKTLAQKRDGKPYLNILLSDKTGTLKGVVWDQAEKMAAETASGDFVQVMGGISEYRGELQLVVKQMTPIPKESVDPADFIPATRRNVEEMFKRLVALAQGIETPALKALLDAFWEDAAFVQKLKTAPAAKKMHHAYVGGLLEHTLSMAILSQKIAEHYSGVDRDLLLAGAILHDIGKTEELTYEAKIDYTDAGRLLNHIIIGLQMIDEKLRSVPDPPAETMLMLKHMIVSHHGARELGAPEPPKTIEAVLLNFIDEIDSKVNGIRDFIATQDAAESWTAYHRVLERHFFHPKE